MRKVVCGVLALASCSCLSGCFQKNEVNPAPVDNPEIIESQTNNSAIALSAIKEALKDDEWVKNHLMLQKSTFGDEAYDDQELNFRKLGEDRVIVNVFAYEKTFGVANTIVSYKNGEVKTFSEPSLDAPGHPGHIGYAVDPVNEILLSSYMHMGYYGSYFYKILDDSVELIASFEGTESKDDGTLLEDEDGTPLIQYTITIDGKEESGITTFDDYEKKVSDYSEQYTIEMINIPFTKENIEVML